MAAGRGPRLTFHATFNCLWCGRAHKTRTESDLEGYALLCPDCIGRAGENEFLRFRLREGLRIRGEAETVSRPEPSADDELSTYYAARAAEYDDWFLRKGRYSRGVIADAAWAADM